MHRRIGLGVLGMLIAAVVSGCYFASEKPLFGPADFERLAFNKTEFMNEDDGDGYLSIRQFGRSSREFMIVSANLVGEGKHMRRDSLELYRAGFVKLADDLYLGQIAPLTIDPAAESEFFRSYVPDAGETVRDDTEPENYIYVYLAVSQGERDIEGTMRAGIEQFQMYALFSDEANEAVAALAQKYGLSLDGYRILSEGVSTERLKAFFLDVYRTQKQNMSEPDIMRRPRN